ncbi:MAG: T9SS type A sorting domain-containing protein, partial [Ignavibacteria bacterium]|nr:T9SS type A sorting domain-containing protein [Ignavibacteria bacterium]
IPSNVKGETINVTLKVYDLLGREVATLVDEVKQPGYYNSKFSIRNFQLSSGIYFYRLQAGNFQASKKLVLAK